MKAQEEAAPDWLTNDDQHKENPARGRSERGSAWPDLIRYAVCALYSGRE